MTAPNDAPRADGLTVVIVHRQAYSRHSLGPTGGPGLWLFGRRGAQVEVVGWRHALDRIAALEDEIVRLREANERLREANAALRERCVALGWL